MVPRSSKKQICVPCLTTCMEDSVPTGEGWNPSGYCPVMGKRIMGRALLPGPNPSRTSCCLPKFTAPHVDPTLH